MERRVLIVWDGESWYGRRVRCIEHRVDLDEKVYHCDAPLSGPHGTVEEAIAALRARALNNRDGMSSVKLMKRLRGIFRATPGGALHAS